MMKSRMEENADKEGCQERERLVTLHFAVAKSKVPKKKESDSKVVFLSGDLIEEIITYPADHILQHYTEFTKRSVYVKLKTGYRDYYAKLLVKDLPRYHFELINSISGYCWLEMPNGEQFKIPVGHSQTFLIDHNRETGEFLLVSREDKHKTTEEELLEL